MAKIPQNLWNVQCPSIVGKSFNSKYSTPVQHLQLCTLSRDVILQPARAVWVDLGTYKHGTLHEEEGRKRKPAQTCCFAMLRSSAQGIVLWIVAKEFYLLCHYLLRPTLAHSPLLIRTANASTLPMLVRLRPANTLSSRTPILPLCAYSGKFAPDIVH